MNAQCRKEMESLKHNQIAIQIKITTENIHNRSKISKDGISDLEYRIGASDYEKKDSLKILRDHKKSNIC